MCYNTRDTLFIDAVDTQSLCDSAAHNIGCAQVLHAVPPAPPFCSVTIASPYFSDMLPGAELKTCPNLIQTSQYRGITLFKSG